MSDRSTTWVPDDEDLDGPAEEAAPPDGPQGRLLGERHEDLGLLGTGATSEVHRVRELRLNRTMAMKILRAEFLARPATVARFLEEAQVTAQLQHPGVLAVHELGVLPDGRHYITMEEVRGRTLAEVIGEVHRAGDRGDGEAWTFRRLVEAFRQVCETVAYAHSRGVVHRDLKPANVMLGAFGVVRVLDWGLARVRGRPDPAAEAGDLDAVVTRRSASATRTVAGTVAGTPAYMAPEQARADLEAIDARSDVYALGAMLYHLLAGRPPYPERDGAAVVAALRAGPPPPVQVATAVELPEALVEACTRAMAREPAERFADARALADALAAWLDGARRRARARAVVEQAAAQAPRAAALRARAAGMRAQARAMLASVEPWRPASDKAAAWALEDEAVTIEEEAERAELAEEHLLAAALTHAPTLPEAHAALAARYRAAHAHAEARRAPALRAEALLRHHAEALPPDHPDRADHLAWLRGDGALTLVTDPPGAEVLLHRYERRQRRLVPVFVRSLGRTPLQAVPLPQGSYLCILRHPDRAEVRYPVDIGRGEAWDGVSPDGTAPTPVPLPRPEDLGPDDCYVPPGWFWMGGDPGAPAGLPRQRLWVDGLVVRRFPVTNAEYLAFLDDLVAQGREDEALAWVPRERSGKEHEAGPMVYGRNDDGTFALVPDADGDLWQPDWPVMMVTWDSAMAYAAWEARRTGLPWRLPGELEWEKAGRGVDGRLHPWGDHLDPSWCCIRSSHRAGMMVPGVHEYPDDVGPYGVRGMAGGVRDWCMDVHRPAGPPLDGARVPPPNPGAGTPRTLRSFRGASWDYVSKNTRLCHRHGHYQLVRYANQGFRLVRRWPGPDAPDADYSATQPTSAST